jgi:Transmembrane domain of unknown function (DUF3566)
VEQRTDETRQPGVAAEDTGPPGDDKPGKKPAADESTASNGHTGGDRESIWDPPPRGGRGPAFPSSSPGSFGSSSADTGASPGTPAGGGNGKTGAAYPADSAYTVDDGYGPPGSERKKPAHDFPSSSVASQTFGAAPAESVYGPAATQRDFSPYPSQVTSPRTEEQPSPVPAPSGPAASSGPMAASAPSGPSAPSEAETTRVDRPSAWSAAASRMPRPQQVPKKDKKDKKDKKGGGANARQAHLMVSRFEPWSVMKFSFMISLACFVILFVAVALLYATLSGLGVFTAIENSLSSVTSGQGASGINITHWLSASTILSYTALLGVLNVFLITAFSTVGSLIYNLTSHLIGGVEVTLRETD